MLKEVLSIIPKIGDGLSFITEKLIKFVAEYGLSVTPLQSKILLILVFGFGIYLLFSVITIAKKILKWGLIGLLIFLLISVTISMFV